MQAESHRANKQILATCKQATQFGFFVEVQMLYTKVTAIVLTDSTHKSGGHHTKRLLMYFLP